MLVKLLLFCFDLFVSCPWIRILMLYITLSHAFLTRMFLAIQ